jgi:hypothetical protein
VIGEIYTNNKTKGEKKKLVEGKKRWAIKTDLKL